MKSLTFVAVVVCLFVSGFVIYFAGPVMPGIVGYFAGLVSAIVVAVAAIIEADEIDPHGPNH